METIAKTELQALLPEESETMQNMFLLFLIEEQSYAIDIHYVIEIIEMMPLTVVPSLPGCMKGIINLRGAVIPIMDVRLRFGLMEAEYTERTCIVVVENAGSMLGLIVDAVQEVTTIEQEKRMPPPSSSVGGNSRYIKGVSRSSNAIQLILDCDKLMDLMG